MLYLEDYLEMIEHLPQELKRELTEMRELDLSVQNSMDTLDKRVRNFFGQCRRGELPQNQADAEYLNIRKDYYKVLEDADEKVQLANQMYELVDRYLRRLDSELHKFKCELEADNHGITDILEKRSLELDNSSNGTIQKENRFFNSVSQNQNTAGSSTTATPRYRPNKTEKRRDSGATLNTPLEKRQALSAGLATPTVRPTTPNLNQVLQTTPAQSVGYSGNTTLIVQAAAQAIEKTQQMQQGRRTASLKASYEAIQSGASVNSHELLMGREISPASAAHSLAAIETINSSSTASSSGQKRQKKKNNTSINNPSINSQQSSQASTSTALLHQLQQSHSNDSDDIVAGVVLNENGLVVEQTTDGEWTYDPNEPRYCICNQVSYGEMVACDNEECPFEWFHYPCVGVTSSPKGKWYCPQCTSSMRRRRKN